MRNPKSQYNPSKDLIIATRLRKDGELKKQQQRDLLLFCEGYLNSLLADAHNRLYKLYSSADYTRDREYVSTRLKNEGFAFVADALPLLMAGVLSLLEGDESAFRGSFKIHRTTCRPAFLRRLTEIATNEENYSTENQALALNYVYNISVCFKKYRGEPDVHSRQQLWDDFRTTDIMLSSINFEGDALEPIMSSIATQWYNFAHDISLDDVSCVPRPGPGATVHSVPKSMRYAPHRMYTQIDQVFPYVEWFYSHPFDLVNQSRNHLEMLKTASDQQLSEFKPVPKTFRKWRGICKETNEAQFIQQALRRLLKKYIDQRLGQHLPLNDQSVHAKRALDASTNRCDATIDESEASDRIARELVSRMTRLTPELHDALMAVSSNYVLRAKDADDPTSKTEIFRTAKFAPMGSAVCFPIMSIVHLFLIRAIILIYCKDVTFSERKDFCARVSVYGDDIILPTECVDLVYEWLPRFGIKINQSKSFVKSFFRESCGCHAYKGIDITPVYIKYTNFSSNIVEDNKQLLSLTAVEYDLEKRGHQLTASFIREHLVAKWGKLPYVTESSPVVGFKRPPFHVDLTDFSSNPKRYGMRWNRHFQCFVFRLPVIIAESEEGCIPEEDQALLRHYCLKPKRDVNYVWGTNGYKSPFSMQEWIRRLDDKTIRLKKVVVPLLESAFHGHVFERCVPRWPS